MYQRLRSRGRVTRLLAAAVLAGLMTATAPAQEPGQTGQTGQGSTTPRFFVGLPVNSENDTHKDAVKKATEYLEGLKDDAKALEEKRARKRPPREYPGERGGAPAGGSVPLDAAVTAAPPPIGPAASLF